MEHKVDLNHYDLKQEFDAWEVACLIAGYEPANTPRADGAAIPGKLQIFLSLIEEAYESACYDLRMFGKGVTHNENDGTLYGFGVSSSSLPSVELWEAYDYISLHDGMPGGFQRDAYTNRKANSRNPKFRREDIEKWLTLRGWAGAQYFVNKEDATEKSLATRERESLLKLVIGMAMKGYRYDPSALKNTAVPEIVSDLQELALTITDDTVRKYLKEARELLPGKSGET